MLATTEAQKVLPTVVDRCHRFDFSRPTAEQLAAVVRRVADQEEIDIALDAVALLARHATGSFRDALGTLEQLVTYSGRSVSTEDVLAVLGVAEADLLFGGSRRLVARDVRRRGARRGPRRDRARLAQVARDVEAHARDLLVVQALGEVPAELRLTPERDSRLAEQARATRSELTRLLDLLAVAMRAVKDEATYAPRAGARRSGEPGGGPVAARADGADRAARGGAGRSGGACGRAAARRGAAGARRRAGRPDGLAGGPEGRLRAAGVGTGPGGRRGAGRARAASRRATGPDRGGARAHARRARLPVAGRARGDARRQRPARRRALGKRPVELRGREVVIAFITPTPSTARSHGAGHRAAVEAALRAVCGTALQVRYELHEIAPTEQPPAPSEDEIVARFVAEFDAEEIVPEPEERKEGEA